MCTYIIHIKIFFHLYLYIGKKKGVKYRRNFICIFNNILLRIHINVISHIIIFLYHKYNFIVVLSSITREWLRSAEKAA